MKDFVIHDKTVTIHKFGAIEGWKLLHKLSSIIAPATGAATSGNYAQAVSMVFNKIDEKEMIALMKQCLEVCLIDGRKAEFGMDCKDYVFAMDLVSEVLRYNFEDFFSQVRERIFDFIGQEETTTN